MGVTVGLSACQEASKTQALLDADLETFRGRPTSSGFGSHDPEDKVGEMTQLTLDMLCVEDSSKTRKIKSFSMSLTDLMRTNWMPHLTALDSAVS